MPTSEPLVPNDQPQGQRQETVAAMKRGGIPLAPQSKTTGPAGVRDLPSGRPAPSSGAPISGLDLLTGRSPADFPFIAEPEPGGTGEPSEPESVASALAASAQSSFARAVAARLAQKE